MKNKLFKRVSSLALAGVCALSFAGCGGNADVSSSVAPSADAQVQAGNAGGETASEDGTQAGTAELDHSDTVEFSIWRAAKDYKYYTDYAENPVVKYLNNKFNVKMTFQLPPMGSETDNFNLMVGTGDYTDLMCTENSTTSLSSLYEDGVIIDLEDYAKQYMPNYYKMMNDYPNYKKAAYDDDGHLLAIYTTEDMYRNQWGGILYRRDILDTMTGGNVQFPSGNDEPTTVEDWDYMLPLMKQYFDASGLAETAPLIIPYNGFTATGEINGGWGFCGTVQKCMDDPTKLEFGPTTDGAYNYAQKMKEWYEKGYIYQDFASRVNDMFYLPNTALTYGGAAGTWFGLLQQAGSIMSNEEYGLKVLAVPCKAPLDTDHGITPEQASFYVSSGELVQPFAISSTCDPDKIPRIMECLDYLYTDEGWELANHGLPKDAAATDTLYQQLGVQNGLFWYDENGDLNQDEVYFEKGNSGEIEGYSLLGQALPNGKYKTEKDQWPVNIEITENFEYQNLAGEVWKTYGNDRSLPAAATMNAEENTKFTDVWTNLNDYINTMFPKFIMGTEELNETTWQAFKDKLDQMGLQQAMDAWQSAYDRYLAR